MWFINKKKTRKYLPNSSYRNRLLQDSGHAAETNDEMV